MSHLQMPKHRGYETELPGSSRPAGQRTLGEFDITPAKAVNIFSWLEWIVMESREFESSDYCVGFINPTSNLVERLFSVAKYIQRDNRKNMAPTKFEETLFLRCNKQYWNAAKVHSVL